MRRVARTSLPHRTSTYLARKQAEVDAGRHAVRTWDNARKTKAMETVAQALALMSGRRQRCMFCGDSRSTDIEHFWPKAVYSERAFRWKNLLWICTGCNRLKGDRFLCDSQSQPLLIDPSMEDPWDFLFFDSQTGNITAKYDPLSSRPDPKGAYTVDPATLPLNVEAVTEGRQRTRRNLVRAISAFLSRATTETGPQLEVELVEAIRDNDDYGLVHWYFQRDGSGEEPFRTFRNTHASVWGRVLQSL